MVRTLLVALADRSHGATVIGVGASAVQKHYFRDLDRTNAPPPETDLFAGL